MDLVPVKQRLKIRPFKTVKQFILLGTTVVKVVFEDMFFSARVPIDSGSQATYFHFRKKLNLPVRNIRATVSGLNGAQAGPVQ